MYTLSKDNLCILYLIYGWSMDDLWMIYGWSMDDLWIIFIFVTYVIQLISGINGHWTGEVADRKDQLLTFFLKILLNLFIYCPQFNNFKEKIIASFILFSMSLCFMEKFYLRLNLYACVYCIYLYMNICKI